MDKSDKMIQAVQERIDSNKSCLEQAKLNYRYYDQSYLEKIIFDDNVLLDILKDVKEDEIC